MTALRDFVADLMEREGAAVETLEPDGLEVIAPPEIRAAFGWPELARLGFGAELPAGARRIGIESEWLDRFGTLLDGHGRRAERQIVYDLPQTLSDPERVLRHALDLPNGVWRFQKQSATWTRCILIAFRTTAVSDEKRESIVWIGFNAGTGAALGEVLPRLRTYMDGEATWQAPDPEAREAAGSGWDAAELEARVRPALDASVRVELAPFLRAMQRRLSRDHARLHGYHDDLRRESFKRLAALEGVEGTKADADRQRENQRIAGDRAGVSGEARRSQTQLRAARHRRLDPDPRAVRARAAAGGADPSPQGRARDPARLASARSDGRAADLRVGARARAPRG